MDSFFLLQRLLSPLVPSLRPEAHPGVWIPNYPYWERGIPCAGIIFYEWLQQHHPIWGNLASAPLVQAPASGHG